MTYTLMPRISTLMMFLRNSTRFLREKTCLNHLFMLRFSSLGMAACTENSTPTCIMLAQRATTMTMPMSGKATRRAQSRVDVTARGRASSNGLSMSSMGSSPMASKVLSMSEDMASR